MPETPAGKIARKDDMINFHACALCYKEHGVLITGEPGSGKSSLLLYLLTRKHAQITCLLISDDQVFLFSHEGQLIADTPDTIAGKIEIYGLGIMNNLPFVSGVPITHLFHLEDPDQIPRLPEKDDRYISILGIDIQRYLIPKNDLARSISIMDAVLDLPGDLDTA